MALNQKILLCLFIAIPLLSTGQKKEFDSRLEGLSYSEQLPEGILSSKTVVLVKVPPKNDSPLIRGSWKPFSEKVQKGLHKAKIDAVTHYYIDDVFSGPEPYNAFLDAFDDRNLSHAVMAEFDGSKYSLTILKMQDRKFIIAAGQEAWRKTSPDLNEILESLYKQTASSAIEKSNLLIIETPEYGQVIDVIEGKRSEFYDLNLKSDLIAVPTALDTGKMAKVMNEFYPFKWRFIDPSLSDKEIRAEGFQFILYHVHSTGEVTKQLLKYPIDNKETAFISEVIIDKKSQVTSQNVNTPVYKFYIKNVRRKNTYIGKRWDAGITWEDGLKNYIFNLRNELIRN